MVQAGGGLILMYHCSFEIRTSNKSPIFSFAVFTIFLTPRSKLATFDQWLNIIHMPRSACFPLDPSFQFLTLCKASNTRNKYSQRYNNRPSFLQSVESKTENLYTVVGPNSGTSKIIFSHQKVSGKCPSQQKTT